MSLAIGHIDHRLQPGKRKMMGARGGLRLQADAQAASRERLHRQLRAKQLTRFRLRGRDGRWANLSLTGWTDREADSWIGFAGQLAAVRRKHPEFDACMVIDVPPVGGGVVMR